MRDNKLMLNTARQMQLVGSDSVVEGKMSLLLNNGVVLPLKAQINTGGGGGMRLDLALLLAIRWRSACFWIRLVEASCDFSWIRGVLPELFML